MTFPVSIKSKNGPSKVKDEIDSKSKPEPKPVCSTCQWKGKKKCSKSPSKA